MRNGRDAYLLFEDLFLFPSTASLRAFSLASRILSAVPVLREKSPNQFMTSNRPIDQHGHSLRLKLLRYLNTWLSLRPQLGEYLRFLKHLRTRRSGHVWSFAFTLIREMTYVFLKSECVFKPLDYFRTGGIFADLVEGTFGKECLSLPWDCLMKAYELQIWTLQGILRCCGVNDVMVEEKRKMD